MKPDLNNDSENPYDFIFKENKQPATPAGPAPNKFGGNNRQMLIFAGFVVVVLIVVMIAFSIITSSNRDTGEEAISVRAYQQEIARVLDLGNQNVSDSQLMQKLVTLELTLLSDRSAVDRVISAKGVAPTDAQLAQYRRSARDTELTDSLQVDKHDEVYEELIDALASSYYDAIRTAQSAARTNRELDSLASVRKNIEIIYNLGQEQESAE